MDHNQIDQFDLVARYLTGKLPAEESALFEEHFVDCPQCIDQLKTTKNFLNDLRFISARQSLQADSDSRRPVWFFSQMQSQRSLAVAACCLLAALLVGIILAINYMQHLRFEINQAKDESLRWQRNHEEDQQAAALSEKQHQEMQQDLTEQIRDLEARLQNEQELPKGKGAASGAQMQPGANVLLFALNSASRGENNSSSADNKIALPNSPHDFVFSLGLEGEEKYKNYRITLLDETGRAILKRYGHSPNRHNSLSIGFNSNFFRPGNYAIKVEGLKEGNDATVVGNFPFVIIKGP